MSLQDGAIVLGGFSLCLLVGAVWEYYSTRRKIRRIVKRRIK